MKVLVDTSVWSLALRRRGGALSAPDARRVDLLRRLIEEFRVMMIGPLRQELLSGIRDRAQFDRLRDHLRAFPDERLEEADYEEAAAMGNACRSEGLATSTIDLLICAAAMRRGAAVMTTDTDFERYATVLPLRLIRD